MPDQLGREIDDALEGLAAQTRTPPHYSLEHPVCHIAYFGTDQALCGAVVTEVDCCEAAPPCGRPRCETCDQMSEREDALLEALDAAD